MTANTVTILRPDPATKHARKRIAADGEILGADNVAQFAHKTVRLNGIGELHSLVTKLADRNVLVVRGHPASDRQPIHRQLAFRTERTKAGTMKERGDDGFTDVAKFWAAFDVDGVKLPAMTDWREDPLAAVEYVIGLLPEGFWDASCSWSFTASHGLERVTKDGKKYWTGGYVGDEVRLRLWFWMSRALAEAELSAWMKSMGDLAPVDASVARTVQPIYVARPVCADGSDPLARLGVQLSGFRQGLEDAVIVPDNLAEEAQWARAEGHGASCASHPTVEAAIRAIGKPSHPKGRAEIRSHLMSAALHLARNERSAGREPDPAAMCARIVEAVEQHRDEIGQNLEDGGRSWGEVEAYVHGGDVFRLCGWAASRVEDDDAKSADGGGRRKRVRRVPHAPKLDGVVFVNQAEARDIARRTIEDFVAAATDYATGPKHDEQGNKIAAPQRLMALPTGSGKTHAAALGVKALTKLGAVAWLVPTHRLGDEAAARIKAAAPDLSVVVRRGMEQPDPAQPGKQMCHRVEDVKAVLEHGLPVASTLCKVETKDADTGETKVTLCPFYGRCGYIAQQAALALADVVVASHAHLFQGVPDDVPTPVAVFVDEAAWEGALGGTDAPVAVGLGTLLDPPTLIDGELRHYRREIGKVLAAEPDGPVRREALAAWISTAKAASDMEWTVARKLPGPVTKLTGQALRDRLEAALGGTYGVKAVKRMTAFWRAVGGAAKLPDGTKAGRLRLLTADKETGAREARISWRAELAKGWDKVPMLLMDATADVTVLRQVFERLEGGARYAVANPHVTVRQVVDRSFAHATLVAPPEALDATGKKAKAARNNAAKVLARLVADAVVRYGGQDVLAVVPKAVEEQWRAAGVPRWLHLVHHGALAGLDGYGHVRAVYVVGRVLPADWAIELEAGALTGVAVSETGYRPAKVIIATTDGKGIETTAWQHPDALCEAIRRQRTEAGLIQAAGRIRAINRTAETPADVHLWVDIAVPELGPVKASTWQGPTIDERMLARGCWFERPGDAATAFPDLGNADAVKKAKARAAADGDICLKDTLRQMSHSGLTLVRYRLAKARSGSAEAIYLGDDPAEARRFLETRLGPLAEFQVEGRAAEQPAEQAPAKPKAPEPRPEAPAPAAHPAPPPRPSPPPKPSPRPAAPLPGLGATIAVPPKPAPFSGLRGLKTVALTGAGPIAGVAPRPSPPPPWRAAAAPSR